MIIVPVDHKNNEHVTETEEQFSVFHIFTYSLQILNCLDFANQQIVSSLPLRHITLRDSTSRQ